MSWRRPGVTVQYVVPHSTDQALSTSSAATTAAGRLLSGAQTPAAATPHTPQHVHSVANRNSNQHMSMVAADHNGIQQQGAAASSYYSHRSTAAKQEQQHWQSTSSPPLQPPLLVTLQLDNTSQTLLNAMREKHFPRERNFIPAHITLFHALPAEQQARLHTDLRDLASSVTPFPVVLNGVQLLGNGVAIQAHASPLHRLRAQLAAQWQELLSRQDRQSFRAHVTVQNKVPVQQAQSLHAELTATWHPLTAHALGMLLWRYQGGPWELIEQIPFAAGRELHP